MKNLIPLRILVTAFLFLPMYSMADFIAAGDFGCEGSTVEQGGCLIEKMNDADDSLNKTYQALIDLVRNHGEDWVEDLRRSERAWLKYRDTNCEFNGNYLKGGSGESLYYSACKLKMTKDRVNELEQFRSTLVERGYEPMSSRQKR